MSQLASIPGASRRSEAVKAKSKTYRYVGLRAALAYLWPPRPRSDDAEAQLGGWRRLPP